MENNKYEMHGKVKIYDENHNLIQEKNNMIVKTGRLEILKLLFNKDTTAKPSFTYFYETGTETKLTTPEMQLSDLAGVTDVPEPEKNVKIEINEANITVKYTSTINYSGKNISPILAVGLKINKDKLFSRAAIDPIYMNPNRTYTVEHTIYL